MVHCGAIKADLPHSSHIVETVFHHIDVRWIIPLFIAPSCVNAFACSLRAKSPFWGDSLDMIEDRKI
jgi:hypothetical protein